MCKDSHELTIVGTVRLCRELKTNFLHGAVYRQTSQHARKTLDQGFPRVIRVGVPLPPAAGLRPFSPYQRGGRTRNLGETLRTRVDLYDNGLFRVTGTW